MMHGQKTIKSKLCKQISEHHKEADLVASIMVWIRAGI
jgi:hypothetical protein